MATPYLPPKVTEKRSQERDVFQVINRFWDLHAQVRSFEAVVTTTLTATPTTIWTSDDLPANAVWDVEVTVLGFATDGSAGRYRRIAGVKRIGTGTSALVGGVSLPVPDGEDVAGWDVTVTASGNGLLVKVTGDVTRTVSWSALARVRELRT